MYSIVYVLQTVGYEMGGKNEKKQLRYKVAGEHCSLWTLERSRRDAGENYCATCKVREPNNAGIAVEFIIIFHHSTDGGFGQVLMLCASCNY